MKNKSAYSFMSVKAVNEDARTITGIASTPTSDRANDVMDPAGAKFTLPMPLLWQHDPYQPIGQITKAKVTDQGIEITASLQKSDDSMPSQMIARLEEAWASIKSGLVRGLSIGFRGIEYSFLDDGGIKFLSWDLMEVSAVTIPCNAECTIQMIKSFSQQERAALGNDVPAGEKSNKAGASAIKPHVTVSLKGNDKMNYAELIKNFETKRASLIADRDAILMKSAEEGTTLDGEETEKYDGIASEIKAVDAHLDRLKAAEGTQASTAKPVTKAAPGVTSTVSAPVIVKAPENLEKGIAFARFAKCLAAANGSRSEALDVAKHRHPDDKKLHHVLKAAVAAGSTTDPTWAGNLVEYQEYAADFVEFLRPQTIVGRFGQGGIPALRRVPFNIRINGQTSGGSAGWVGEGKAKPLTKFDFDTVNLGWAKIASISVLTEELVRFSNPAADTLVRNALADTIIERMDLDFIDPAKAAVAGVSPASITNGAPTHASTGDVETDIALAFGDYITANLNPTGAVWLMSATTALALTLRKNALGQREYPEITLTGGTLAGLPIIISQYVGNRLILVNAPDIYLADDGGVAIDMSREASLEMMSNPTQDSVAGTGTQLVSMFQTNSVAIRAERWINWQRRRPSAVSVITGIAYGANGDNPTS